MYGTLLFLDKWFGYIKDKIRNKKKWAIRKFGNLLPLIQLGYGSIVERNLSFMNQYQN